MSKHNPLKTAAKLSRRMLIDAMWMGDGTPGAMAQYAYNPCTKRYKRKAK